MEPQRTRVLLDSFFNYVHVKNPILDEVQTRRIVTRLCLHGIDWSPESCIALLVCALGAIATPFDSSEVVTQDSEAYATAKSFYSAAQKRLGVVLGTSGVLEAQCLFLAGAYMMCIFERVKAWRFFVQSLACCQEFDFLHRSRAVSDNIPDHIGRYGMQSHQSQQASIAEQAIYWSAWKSERELRHELQAPDFRLPETEVAIYPPFFPTPPPPNEDLQSGLSDEYRQRERVSWYFYLSEISLRRLSSRIADDILAFQPQYEENLLEGLAKATSEHEAQAHEWVMALPDVMTLQSPPEEDNVCKFVLRGHLINFYETIYWPFVDAVINCPLSGGGIHWSPLLRNVAHKGLQKHVERLQVNRPGFHHRHHGTPIMIYHCTRSALVLMAAALVAKDSIEQGLSLPLEMPPDWQNAVIAAIELNRHWENESPESRSMLHVLEVLWESVR
ncbi:Zcf27p [Coniosporium apollinis]|uniref:Zcf27p n=1 Tax=Coniosporium apollinis TaxID=61459 RepID=A0ABQ9NTS7_9PEZI|nr:Zcf27p [Coniosporium apollinis]